MCNGISPVEDVKSGANDLIEGMHYCSDPAVGIGNWGWSLCGLRRQVTGIGKEGITCQECASRMSSYGY